MKYIAFILCMAFLLSAAYADNSQKNIRILYFYSNSCRNCEANMYVFLKFEEMLKGIIKIERADKKMARQFKVEHKPTLIILVDKKIVYQKTGVAQLSDYVNAAKKAGIKLN